MAISPGFIKQPWSHLFSVPPFFLYWFPSPPHWSIFSIILISTASHLYLNVPLTMVPFCFPGFRGYSMYILTSEDLFYTYIHICIHIIISPTLQNWTKFGSKLLLKKSTPNVQPKANLSFSLNDVTFKRIGSQECW